MLVAAAIQGDDFAGVGRDSHENSRDFEFVFARRKPGCYDLNRDRLCNEAE